MNKAYALEIHKAQTIAVIQLLLKCMHVLHKKKNMQAWTKDIDKVHHLQTLKTPTIAILQPVTERNECNALKKYAN